MADLATAVSESDFESAVKDGVTLVDFWAPWCGPCRALGKTLEDIQPQLAAQGIKILKVNVDEADSSMAPLAGITSLPTLMVYKNGEKIAVKTGGISAAGVHTFLRDAI